MRGGKVRISGQATIMSGIFDDIMNEILHWNDLQNELEQSITRLLNKSSYIFQKDFASWHI